MTTTNTTTTRNLVSLGLLALVLGAAFAVCNRVAREGLHGDPPPPESTGIEVHQFKSLNEMVSASDLVVVGTIQDVRTILIGYSESEPPAPPTEEETVGTDVVDERVSGLELELEVEETFKGRSTTKTVTVADLDLDRWNLEWRKPSQRVVLFLTKETDPQIGNFYWPLSSQSVYLVTGEDLAPAVTVELSESVGAMSLSELRSAVESSRA